MIRSILALLLAPAAANAGVDTAALDRAVEAFAGARIGEAGGPIAPVDRRLRLADCSAPPALTWRSERRDAIVIQCADRGAWRLFVPVKTDTAFTTVAAKKAEPVIRRGDPVSLTAESAGFAVSSEGVAMGDAAPGGRVLLKVEGAKAPVQAIAIEAGRATLPGW